MGKSDGGATDLHAGLEGIVFRIRWIAVGFLIVSMLGLVQHAYWVSATLALVGAVFVAPPIHRRTFGGSSERSAPIGALSVAVAGLVVGGVAEWERSQQLERYMDRRDAIIESAKDALAAGDLHPITQMASRYQLIDTPELDRLAGRAVMKMEAKEDRLHELERRWIEAVGRNPDSQ